MFFKILIHYILGYVRINVEGYFIERFINICRSKKIFLWNLKRKNSSIMYVNIGIGEFKQIKEIASTTKCKIKIEDKRGLPFLLHRYKKRKIFLFCLLIMLGAIVTMSNFVWNIDVIGNTSISTEELMQSINENGLTIGKWKKTVDTKKVINEIRLHRPDIAWVGIHMKGTNAIVEVVEADKKPEIIDENEYCSIVSDKEGVIVKIDAANGTALVTPGDVIKQGTVLVGGWIEGKYTGTRYVHAKGEIKAKVWYTARETVSYKQTIKERTGIEERKYSLKIHNFRINLYKKLSKFENYDTIETSQKMKLFSDFYIPVEVIECNNYEINEKQIEYSVEEAKQKAKELAEEKLRKQIPDTEQITNITVNFYEKEDQIEAEVTYEVLENIGTKEKIVF